MPTQIATDCFSPTWFQPEERFLRAPTCPSSSKTSMSFVQRQRSTALGSAAPRETPRCLAV